MKKNNGGEEILKHVEGGVVNIYNFNNIIIQKQINILKQNINQTITSDRKNESISIGFIFIGIVIDFAVNLLAGLSESFISNLSYLIGFNIIIFVVLVFIITILVWFQRRIERNLNKVLNK